MNQPVSLAQKDVQNFDRHAQIRCGTIGVGDLHKSLALYQDFLGLELVEEGLVDEALASCWGRAKMADSRYALLQPGSGAKSYIRLVEVPESKAFTPATTFGWNAFEISIREAFSLSEKLKNSGFDIVGPPKLVDGFTHFIPMQVVGPDGEVLFLNQVIHSDEQTDLPLAKSRVDEIFIVVVASPDREKTVGEHVRYLGLEETSTHSLRYGLINRAFDFDPETQQIITMVQLGKQPYGQIDQYPEEAMPRPTEDGKLPPGNSMVTLMVDDIDALDLDAVVQGAECRPEGHLYNGRRVKTIQCSASEIIELIEI